MKALLSVVVACVAFLSTTSAQCIEGNCQNGRGTYQFENGNKTEAIFAVV